jgi:cell wall-associated NlpC family hydrolase
VPTATTAGNVIVTPVPVVGGPSAVVARVIAEAMTWLGTRYLWGGCDRRGIDCSCFVQTAWAAGGVHLSRTTTTQVREVAFVPREQIQAGDLVFFNNTCTDCGANPTHVGLALGGGQMINAGDPVQIASITTGFYASHYSSAGRVVR